MKKTAKIFIKQSDHEYAWTGVEVKGQAEIHGEKFFIHRDRFGWKCSHYETGMAIGRAQATKKELMGRIREKQEMPFDAFSKGIEWGRETIRRLSCDWYEDGTKIIGGK